MISIVDIFTQYTTAPQCVQLCTKDQFHLVVPSKGSCSSSKTAITIKSISIDFIVFIGYSRCFSCHMISIPPILQCGDMIKHSRGKTFMVFVVLHSIMNLFLWIMALLISNISLQACYHESFSTNDNFPI